VYLLNLVDGKSIPSRRQMIRAAEIWRLFTKKFGDAGMLNRV
jgi:hypothetical protein